ncbi:Rieske (2Fe-2S) protein [Bacillus sp. Marseille-P3661]|uniref:Rieske (2Fe-2S) protein n=1 Tax=Bacillus sp. Marseille-P3661 TaxID=1936234 RepID=UPI000C838365|nr:Rieske (2Fe-2S) protein [Bacillus sp. Marseille-P3661]
MGKMYFVAQAKDISPEQGVTIRTDNDTEIGIYKVKDHFVAYESRCPHQGGPICQGVVLGRYEQVLADDKTLVEERFSEDETHVVCPWHGWEFDLSTGECAADRKFRLRSYQVEVRGEDVYVHVKE